MGMELKYIVLNLFLYYVKISQSAAWIGP